MADIIGFLRRIVGWRRPEKTGEAVPLEEQEIPEEGKRTTRGEKITGLGKRKNPAEEKKKTEKERSTKKKKTG